MMAAREKITKIVEKWYLCEPLYFAVWTLHKVESNTRIKTIRVQRGHVEYNPVFIDSLSPEDLESVLSFEAMRIVLKHPYSRKKDLPDISYLASNITIKEYIEITGLGFLSAREFFGSHEYDRRHFEFYYDKILERAQTVFQKKKESDSGRCSVKDNDRQSESERGRGRGEETENVNPEAHDGKENTPKDGDGAGETGDGTGETGDGEGETGDGAGETGDDENGLENYTNEKSTGYENACNWNRSDYQEQLINEKIQEVSVADTWGTIPASIQENILATLKPKIDYKMILKSFRASILSSTRRLTRMKPSRRYDFLYMGSRRDFTTKLLFAVDVSGSVSHAALRNGFSIMNRFFRYGIEEISVICFDSEIKGKPLTLKKAKKEIDISGRGGTDFSVVIDFIDKERNFDGVIIFTDGYAPCPAIPKNKKTKILWLFDTESNFNRCKSHLSKLGKTAFVKEI